MIQVCVSTSDTWCFTGFSIAKLIQKIAFKSSTSFHSTVLTKVLVQQTESLKFSFLKWLRFVTRVWSLSTKNKECKRAARLTQQSSWFQKIRILLMKLVSLYIIVKRMDFLIWCLTLNQELLKSNSAIECSTASISFYSLTK